MAITKKCFNCGDTGYLHRHHVVPSSRGGTNTILLCEKCHSMVHKTDLSTSYLTRLALIKKDKEVLAHIFVLLLINRFNYDEVANDFNQDDLGNFSVNSIKSKVRRLLKIKINDLLDIFDPIIKFSENKVYNREYFIFLWELFMQDYNRHYTKRILFLCK